MAVVVVMAHSISVVDQPIVVVGRSRVALAGATVVIATSYLTGSEKVRKETNQLPKRSTPTSVAIVKEKVPVGVDHWGKVMEPSGDDDEVRSGSLQLI